MPADSQVVGTVTLCPEHGLLVPHTRCGHCGRLGDEVEVVPAADLDAVRADAWRAGVLWGRERPIAAEVVDATALTHYLARQETTR